MTTQEAIEVLKNDIEICTIQQEQACDMAIKALEQTELNPSYNGVKSEFEQTRWIPVSERMPEEDGYYVVSGGGKVWVCEMLNLTNTVKGWCNSIRKPSVEAWCELPQPYKEDEE